jgi:hypothetical protein
MGITLSLVWTQYPSEIAVAILKLSENPVNKRMAAGYFSMLDVGKRNPEQHRSIMPIDNPVAPRHHTFCTEAYSLYMMRGLPA